LQATRLPLQLLESLLSHACQAVALAKVGHLFA